MFAEGAYVLDQHSERVDALNVFPVPDGDTGTNMSLTINSGVKEMKQGEDTRASAVAKHFSKGLLMGARGNSGVILSQLFRGFAKGIEKKDDVDGLALAAAFENGVDTAYRAVMKPVEGTILSVAKDAAKAARKEARKHNDADAVLEETLAEARRSLERTPDLLPVLKEVGVVDSGGQGLLHIYEGMQAGLRGESTVDHATETAEQPSMDSLVEAEHHHVQGDIAPEDIEFGYCTEIMIRFDEAKTKENPFNEDAFRSRLSEHGDSLLVVSDEDLLKIHIHVEYPGAVMDEAQKYGELINVKIDNMREQHAELSSHMHQEATEQTSEQKQTYAVIAVTMGSGIQALFESLGVEAFVEGGQTMNPSTEQFIEAIDKTNAEHVFLIPNNGNIVMTAEQAADVFEGIDVRVIPTKSVPQGLGAMFAFNEEEDVAANAEAMNEGMSTVKSASVTKAIRDTTIGGVDIKENDFMGLLEGEIVSSGETLEETLKKTAEAMIDQEIEMLTVIAGEDADEDCTEALASHVEERYEDVETEIHDGKQPLYHYILSAE
ncbi:DAK2 domain-containing protein [Salicibibacter cibarius]|uniref:DAK2 domain-containing protein n=1 Tax=Salicibibacter cibarius TaxID=2743000 RepID=A0A7T7CDS8_9BACI|nr:DAK2 domain-containing protein [Salicibibacter cibarius]QQK78334.1 DAK2 domain-containing protein [Salicibibacter cibarius]